MQDLESWLEELVAERARLDVLIAELSKRLGQEPPDVIAAANLTIAAGGTRAVSSVGGKLASDAFFRMSIPEGIKKFLAIKKSPQSPTAIVEGLRAGGMLTNAKSFYGNVTTALKRLRDTDEVVNTQQGWGLGEWYPNRSKVAVDTKPKQKARTKAKAKEPKGRSSKTAPAAERSETPKLDAALRAARGMGYKEFASEQMKAGKKLPEISDAWKVYKESL